MRNIPSTTISNFKKWIQDFDFKNPKKVRRFLWLGLTLLFLGFFLKITWELHEEPSLKSLDQQILVLFSHFRFSALNGPAVDMTALGSPTVLTLISVIGVVLLWLNKDLLGCVYLTIGGIGAGIGTYSIKHFITRARPNIVPRLIEVSGYSYPSGHSLGATSVYLLLLLLAWRHYKSWRERGTLMICASFIIGGVCLSRIYLGVHYPSDVISGALLGAAWVCLLTYFFFRDGISHN